jgi:hypothetical protein
MTGFDPFHDKQLALWQAAWPKALAHWSKYTRLHDPILCRTSKEAANEGLTTSFAMIRFADKSIVIDLEEVRKLGLDDYAVEILAHEIGHHVLAPATATDHFRLLARLRTGLPTLEAHAAKVANLYTDLLINDRLQRQEGLHIDGVYAKIHAHQRKSGVQNGKLWLLYAGIYEELWSLPRGTIGGPVDGDDLIGAAWLGARLVRVYARDWLTGGSRFAALVLPYLLDDDGSNEAIALLQDTAMAGEGSVPQAISDIDPDEVKDLIHPSADPKITGQDVDETSQTPDASDQSPHGNQAGQRREPFAYGEILRAGGLTLSDTEIAIRYYREQALPHLVRFPVREQTHSSEPQLEGLEPWDIGDPLDEIDWLQTLTQSPIPVPGVTTLRRVYGAEPGTDRKVEPVDLDIYVDSSGSMPNPAQRISYLTLAGAIIALSALKVGSRVQATLWSGKNQFMCTDGFTSLETDILSILTGFYGGGTAFPIHKLRDTYASRKETDRDVHILIISDDGISTMFNTDERGGSGWDVSAMAMKAAGGGGTMALNLYANREYPWQKRVETEQGWHIAKVTDYEQLIAFARAFSQRHYSQKVIA